MEMLLFAGIGLLGLSLLLIVIEAFIPSGGIIGVVAALCAAAGVIALWRFSTVWGIAGLLTVSVLGPMCFVWAMRIMPHTAIGRQLLGPDTVEPTQEQLAARQAERDARLALLDQTGTTLTDLRPIGTIEVDGQPHEASAEGGLIDRGQRVRVTGIDGMQIRVRAV